MSASEVIQQWVNAVNRRDPAAMAALYAPNAVVHDPQYPSPLEGRDSIQQDMADFLSTFPDLEVTVRSTVVSGNDYALEAAFTATHGGPLLTPGGELPPTGRRVNFDAAGFYRLDGQGRVLEERRYLDLARIAAQLGAGA